MSSVYSNSPRGLIFNVVDDKWPKLCAKLIPHIVALEIDPETEEAAFGEIELGSNNSKLSWAVGFEEPNKKSVFIGFRSGIGGEMHSHSIVPVLYDASNANHLIIVDSDLKDTYSGENVGVNPTMQTITALMDFVDCIDAVLNDAEFDQINDTTTRVI